MNALALLTAARDAGVKVTLAGTKIILEGDALTDDLVASFKANKPEILKLLVSVPASTSSTTASTTADPAMVCDDCHRPAVALLVTDYGSRYCRECVFPSKTAPKAKRGAH